MAFTSSIFLIGFLPWFLLFFFLFRKQITVKKVLLVLVNSIFYLWGGMGAFLFLCGFVFVVYSFCTIIRNHKNRKLMLLFVGIVILPLLVTKYTGFLIGSLNSAFGFQIAYPEIVIPLGISFFSFQAISLLADVFTGKITEKTGFWEVYSYLSFFPTVTSGPIIRFTDFKKGFENKIEQSCYGEVLERIFFGLCKKVLLADKLAILANFYFDGVTAGKTFSAAGLWIGSLAYTLQLYFDFSGYSDMAIGIGKLLGFEIGENFHHPYRAKSISDFWRRWHISLSRWFRDYIYIPLGGNRCNPLRHIGNLFIVWLLTGIWHGAGLSFLLWGMGYFVFLAAEKYVPFIEKIGKKWYGHLYTLFFVNLLWIPFRADSLTVAVNYVAGMFGIGSKGGLESRAVAFLPYILFSAALCFPWEKLIAKWSGFRGITLLKGILMILLTVLAFCAVISSSYTTYIYGNF